METEEKKPNPMLHFYVIFFMLRKSLSIMIIRTLANDNFDLLCVDNDNFDLSQRTLACGKYEETS